MVLVLHFRFDIFLQNLSKRLRQNEVRKKGVRRALDRKGKLPADIFRGLGAIVNRRTATGAFARRIFLPDSYIRPEFALAEIGPQPPVSHGKFFGQNPGFGDDG